MAAERHLIEIEEVFRVSGLEGVKSEVINTLRSIAEEASRIEQSSTTRGAGSAYAEREVSGVRSSIEQQVASGVEAGTISPEDAARLKGAFTRTVGDVEKIGRSANEIAEHLAGVQLPSQASIREEAEKAVRAQAAAGARAVAAPPPPASQGASALDRLAQQQAKRQADIEARQAARLKAIDEVETGGQGHLTGPHTAYPPSSSGNPGPISAETKAAAQEKADAAGQQATALRILATETDWAKQRAEQVRQGYQLHAQVTEELASNSDYAGYRARATTAQAQINQQMQAQLADSPKYLEAQAAVARSRAEQQATIQEDLATTGQFAQAQARAARAKAEIAASTQAELASTGEYAASTVRATQAKALINAKVQEALAADGEYAKVTARAAAARDRIATQTAAAGLEPDNLSANINRRVAEANLAAQQQGGYNRALLEEPGQQTIGRQAQSKLLQEEVDRQRNIILEQNRSEEFVLAQTQQLAALKERRVTLERGLAAGVVANDGESNASIRGRTAAAEQAQAAEQRAVTAREILANERGELDQIVAQKSLERQLNQTIEQRVRQANIEQNGGQIGEGGSLFQRLQATLQARQSGDVVDPTRLMGLGQFVASRTLTTVGFAMSGAALYGAVRTIKDMVTEAEQLDQVSAQVRAQFDALGRGDQFDGFRSSMLDIARETGMAGQEVLQIGAQMQGAFQDPATAVDQTRQAIEAMRVTGLSGAEALNTFVAMTKTFGGSVADVSDEALSLQDHFGIAAKEIINASASIAPVAKEVGLSQTQLMAIVAASAQATGKSTSSVAEGFGRILPEVQKSAGPILELFRQVPKLQGDLTKASNDFATGNEGQALVLLFQHWKDLSGAQQSAFFDMLGGRKNAQDLAAALNEPDKLIAAMAGNYTEAGRTSRSFAAYQDSLAGILARVGEQLRQMGDALARTGALDSLKLLAGGVLGVVTVIASLLKAADDLNRSLGGWPGRIAAAVFAFKALELVVKAVTTAQETLAGVTAAGRGLGVIGENGGIPIVPAAGEAAAAETGAVSAVAQVARAGEVALPSGLLLPAGAAAAGARAAEAQVVRKAVSAPADIMPSLMEGEGVGRLAMWTGARGVNPAPFSRLFAGIGNLGMRNVPGMSRVPSFPMIGGEQGIGGAAGLDGTGWLAAGSASLGLATAGVGALDMYEINRVQQKLGDLRKDRSDAAGINQDTFRHEDLRELIGNRDTYRKPGGAAGVRESVGDFLGGKLGFGGLVKGQTAAENQQDQAIREETVREFNAAADQGLFSALPKGQIEDLRKKLNDSGGKKGAADAQRKLLALSRSQYQQVREAADDAKRISQTQTDAAAGNTTVQLQTVQTIQEQLNAGQTSVPEAISAIRQQIGDMRQSDPSGTNANLQQQIRTALSTLQSVEQKAISDRISLAQTIAQGTGQTPGAPMLAAVVQAINQFGEGVSGAPGNMGLNASGIPNSIAKPGTQTPPQTDLTPDQQMQLGTQGYSAGYQKWQDQIAHAGSAQKALDIAKAGAAVDPAVRAQLTKAYEDKWHEKLDLPDYQASPQDLAQLSQNVLTQTISQIQVGTAQRSDTLDPAVTAKMNQAIAQATLDAARALPQDDPTRITKINQAQLQVVQANQAAAQVPFEIARAQQELNKAMLPDDRLAQARAAQAEADIAARSAHGKAAQLQAQAQRMAADHQMQDAMFAISQSQIKLLQTQASVAGDMVGAARQGVTLAQNELNKAISEHADPGKIADLTGAVDVAKGQLRDATIQNTEDTVQFNLDMRRITIGQAIEQLNALLAIANPKEQMDILRKIQALRTQAGQDLQFNIPADIKLPTLYEVRRNEQTPAGQGYNDNRQVSVVMHINNGMDQAAATKWLTDTVGRSPRVSAGSRRV